MKKLSGFLALTLLSAGITTAQDGISTTTMNNDLMEVQLQNTDNAVATDRDIIIIDRRDPPKPIFDTAIEELIQKNENKLATDRDIIIIDRRDPPKPIQDITIENLIQNNENK